MYTNKMCYHTFKWQTTIHGFILSKENETYIHNSLKANTIYYQIYRHKFRELHNEVIDLVRQLAD